MPSILSLATGSNLSATEHWPNKTTEVLDFTDPAAVRDALLTALGTMHLDKSVGSDGHNSGCNTKAEFLIAHRDELIDAAWRRIERLMAFNHKNLSAPSRQGGLMHVKL